MNNNPSKPDAASKAEAPGSGDLVAANSGSPLAKLEGEGREATSSEFNDLLFDGLIDRSDSLVYDSTGNTDVSLVVEKDHGDAIGDPALFHDLEQYSQQPVDTSTAQADLNRGIDLQRKWNALTTNYWSRCSATHTKYMIIWGLVWNRMYKLVDHLGLKWDRWIANNFGERSYRTVEDWRKLARVPNVMAYSHLGKARLLKIAGALDKTEGADPIGVFKAEYNIPLDSEDNASLGDIQIAIDKAVLSRQLQKAEIKIDDPKMIEKLVKLGAHKEVNLVHDLQLIKNSDGDVMIYLKMLYANRGKISDELRSLVDPQKNLEHFNRIGSRMKNLAAVLIKNEKLLEDVDLDILRDLIQELTIIKSKKVG